jgi:hypothetical protein
VTTRRNAGRHAPTPLALLALLALAAGCSKDKDVEKPAELVDFEPTLSVDRLWSASAGGGARQPTVRRGERVVQIAFGSGFKCNSAVWLKL